MINPIMMRIVEVTMVGRVKEIEDQGGIYKISLYSSTREFFLEKDKTGILPIIEKSKNKEIPVIVVFDGKTGKILQASIHSSSSV